MSKKKILFINHQANKTGAPLILLQFLQWLKTSNAITFHTISPKGVLLNSFKNICKIHLWQPITLNNYKENTLKKHLYKGINLIKEISNNWMIQFLPNPKIIYANTVVSLKLAIQIKQKHQGNPKIILHLHELATIIKLQVPDFPTYISEINHFIVPSNLVKTYLEESCKVNPTNISLIREFSQSKNTERRIAKDEAYFHVGGSGLVHWRKGHDLFIQVANYIVKKHPKKKIKFTWVGKLTKEQAIIIKGDLEKAGLVDVVEFIGEQEHPIDYFQTFDIFLLPSREDPFPLVGIEVGMLGKPIICFEKATGTAEILKNGGGFIVPYLDVEAMAEKVIYYYNNPESVKKDGNLNQQQFSKFTPEIQCPKIYKVILQVLNQETSN